MSDEIDAAQAREQQDRDAAMGYRKPADSPMCEFCEEHPRAVLPNGARARWCDRCLPEMQGAQVAQLVGDWDAMK